MAPVHRPEGRKDLRLSSSIKRSGYQEKRRNEALERQRNARQDATSHARELADKAFQMDSTADAGPEPEVTTLTFGLKHNTSSDLLSAENKMEILTQICAVCCQEVDMDAREGDAHTSGRSNNGASTSTGRHKTTPRRRWRREEPRSLLCKADDAAGLACRYPTQPWHRMVSKSFRVCCVLSVKQFHTCIHCESSSTPHFVPKRQAVSKTSIFLTCKCMLQTNLPPVCHVFAGMRQVHTVFSYFHIVNLSNPSPLMSK